MPFSKDNTPYHEAILYPDGSRLFFLAESGIGMPAKTSRLADKVIQLLNAIPTDEMQRLLTGDQSP